MSHRRWDISSWFSSTVCGTLLSVALAPMVVHHGNDLASLMLATLAVLLTVVLLWAPVYLQRYDHVTVWVGPMVVDQVLDHPLHGVGGDDPAVRGPGELRPL